MIENYWVNRIRNTGAILTTPQNVTTDRYNNIYVSMYYLVAGPNYNIMIAKYNSAGTPQWARQIITSGTNANEFAYGISATPEGDVYLTGYTNQAGQGGFDLYVLKWNTSGILQWQRTYGTSSVDTAFSSAIDANGNLYVGGQSNVGGNNDFLLMKINSSGTILWQKTFGQAASDISPVLSLTGNNLVLLGNLAGTTATLFKFGLEDTNFEWARSITGVNGRSCYIDSGGNTVVTGTTNSAAELWVGKFNDTGTLLWQKTIDQTAGNDTAPYVYVDSTGNIYIHNGATSGSSTSIIKLNSTGNIEWQRSLSSTSSNFSAAITIDYGGAIVALTSTVPGANSTETLLSRLRRNGDGVGTYGAFTYSAISSYSSVNASNTVNPLIVADFTIVNPSSMVTGTPALTESPVSLSNTFNSIANVTVYPDSHFMMFG